MSLPSRRSPDPGDSGDFGVTDLSGDLGGSRDREAVSRMDNLGHCRCIMAAHCDPGHKGGACKLRAGGTVNAGGGVCSPRGATPPTRGAVEARELVEATRGLLHALQWGDADQLRTAQMEASEAVRAADHPEGTV